MIRPFAGTVLLACIFMTAASDHSPGPVTITRCEFDTVNLVVRLSWISDSVVALEGTDLGIAVSCIPGDLSRPGASFRPMALSVDTVFPLPDAVFDTNYTISIWTKFQGEWTPPNSAATRTVRVASSVRQPVSYFSSNAHDTVKALAGRLELWKGPDFPVGIFPTIDTVAACALPDSALQGFVPIGTGVQFLHPEPSPAFFLALTYPDVSAGRGARYYRLYKDSLGIVLVQRSAIVDSAHKRIYVKTFDISYPYFILADTTQPIIHVLSDTSRPLDSIPVIDSVSVIDNSVNLAWAFYRAAGGQPCNSPVSSGSIKTKSGRILCPIPPVGVQAAGVRAFLIVSDGVFTDTIILSRRALRPHSDATTSPARTVIPVALTAEPEKPNLRSCLKGLFEKSGNTYDQSVFRIFRWYPNGSNSRTSDKWVEYPSSDNAAFQCRPGALFWLITSQSATIDFGTGTTISLESPYAIRLPPHNWTDFGVPFGFNIPLSAVIIASGPSAENLVVYRWLPDAPNRTYRAELVYGSKHISGDSVSDTLFSGPGTGYTVYNPSDAEVGLTFPPFSVSMQGPAAFQSAAKRAQAGSHDYCIKVIASGSGADVSTVYCGGFDNLRDTVLIPSPPSFSSTSLKTSLPGGSSGSIMLYPGPGNDLDLFPLSAGIGTERPLTMHIRTSLIKAARPVEFCCIRKSADGVSRLADDFEATFDRGANDDFFLIAGSHDRIESFLSGQVPDRSSRISYHLKDRELFVSPGGLKPGDCFEVTIFDLRGKRISRGEKIQTVGSAIIRPVAFNLPSGIFVCKSVVYSAQKSISETRCIMVPK